MLTSKEVLEKTGISRATLNNYISSGIVPRPEVLPPQPSDGAAPRIGYFPPDIVERIEEIQRLKREGWSITRITEHFTGGGASKAAKPHDAGTGSSFPAVRSAPGDRTMPSLSFGEVVHPAYLVNERFELVWSNAAANSTAWPNYAPLPPAAIARGVLQYVLQEPNAGLEVAAESRNAVLRLHLGLARQRRASVADLCRGMAPAQAAVVERLYGEAERFEFPLVVRAPVVTGPPGDARLCYLYALNFREGILFVYVPGTAAAEEVSTLLAQPAPAAAAPARAGVPAFGPVAVLVMDLQDSGRLGSELPGEEYFELIDQIRAAAEPIFRRHGGTRGKHPAEGMVCHFFPQPDSSYLWNAIAAAHEVREAMRGVSNEWQLRKGWATGLYMNSGIDEGHEWHRTAGPGAPLDAIVLGDAMRHATQISNIGRAGSIWATRNLVGKLSDSQRQQLEYGVRRQDKEGRDVLVASIFSRVKDLVGSTGAGNEDLKAIGALAVTEIFGLVPAGRGAGPARRQ
ncbi:MAG: hypothetical protein JWQ07_1619 [Ramlibacter sp.]|nr:hypothetical protein [Ramlibacter sp.]